MAIILLWTVMPLAASAQTSDLNLLKTWQLKGYAQNALQNGDLYTATDLFSELVKRKPANVNYVYNLALMYYKTNDVYNAYKHFNCLTGKLRSNKYPDAYFYQGKILMSLGDYNAAIQNFNYYEKYNNSGNPEDIASVQNAKIGCYTALSQSDTVLNTKIYHLKGAINNAGIEFSPLILNENEIIFGSATINDIQYFSAENLGSAQIRKFHKGSRTPDSLWIVTDNPEPPFYNFTDAHTGNGCFSPDKNRFYFTKCLADENNKIICQLVVSEYKNNVWSIAQPLNNTINLPGFTASQPTVGTCYNPQIEVLYFVSDRPGGLGGTDIWYTLYNLKTKTYSEPKVILSGINTPGNEMSPFYNIKYKTLYFSSDFLPGFGGFDIYKTMGEIISWTKPTNLGIAINSSFDDLYYTISSNQIYGYFTSNRDGTIPLKSKNCCDDIFYFEKTTQEFILVKGKIFKNDITATLFTDTVLNRPPEPLDSASLMVTLIEPDEKPIYISTEYTNTNGEFEFNALKNKNYKVTISDKRSIDSVFMVNTLATENITQITDTIQIKTIPEKPIILHNILYLYNQYDLTESARNYIDTSLVIILNTYPNLKMEIIAHTDNLGTPEYNYQLSQNRAMSVVTYLESKGINSKRLIAIGLGSNFPIAPNTNPNGSDNPLGRSLNRRTEFRIFK